MDEKFDDFVMPLALPEIVPNRRRSELVRARCRARLQRPPGRARSVGNAVLAGLWVAYACALSLSLLRIRAAF